MSLRVCTLASRTCTRGISHDATCMVPWHFLAQPTFRVATIPSTTQTLNCHAPAASRAHRDTCRPEICTYRTRPGARYAIAHTHPHLTLACHQCKAAPMHTCNMLTPQSQPTWQPVCVFGDHQSVFRVHGLPRIGAWLRQQCPHTSACELPWLELLWVMLV